jgi:hypothetical protein
MVSITRSLKVFSDGSVTLLEGATPPPPPPTGPTPQPEPTTGTRQRQADTFVYAIHDNLDPGMNYQARTLIKQTIAMTNEFRVPRRWYYREDVYEWRVDPYSKISFWPEDLSPDWEQYFFSGMTPRQHGLFNLTAFGWRDSKANGILALLSKWFAKVSGITAFGIRPDGVNIYSFLVTGGTLFRKVGTWRQWTLVACQDTTKPAQWLTYKDAPDLWFKQGVCGHNADKQSFFGKVNANIGDLFLPTACPGGIAALLTWETREVRAVPFDTVLDDVLPVRFVELCYRGSEVLGRTSENEWYFILEQVGHGGGQSDFVLHIPQADWVDVLPISTVDWQKE